jgi:hypothetical protein
MNTRHVCGRLLKLSTPEQKDCRWIARDTLQEGKIRTKKTGTQPLLIRSSFSRDKDKKEKRDSRRLASPQRSGSISLPSSPQQTQPPPSSGSPTLSATNSGTSLQVPDRKDSSAGGSAISRNKSPLRAAVPEVPDRKDSSVGGSAISRNKSPLRTSVPEVPMAATPSSRSSADGRKASVPALGKVGRYRLLSR